MSRKKKAPPAPVDVANLAPIIQPTPEPAPIMSDECTCPACRCDVATCPNGKCQQTGVCIERRYYGSGELIPTVASPSIAPERPTRRIVAFSGLAGSGKSTAAQHLVAAHGFTRVRFAGPLKSMMVALGLTSTEIDGDAKEKPCALLGGKTPRFAMQTIGTEWGRDLIAPDLWIRAWQAAVAKVPPEVSIVVDDCRFPNEAAAILDAGGVIVRILRDGAGHGAAGHPSEGQELPWTLTIANRGSLRDLLDDVDATVRDLSWVDKPAA